MENKFKISRQEIIIIIICIFALMLIQLQKYRFGYFVNGPEMNSEHSTFSDILTMDDGNLLILGSNRYEWSRKQSVEKMRTSRIPSEIYDVKNNKFVIFNINDDIAFQPKGIILKNNKLLLTFVHNPKDPKYKNFKRYKKPIIEDHKPPFLYDSMAIVDLKTHKVEKMIQKKMNKKYRPEWKHTSITLLNNGKVLLMNFNKNMAEIYNPDTNTSKLLNINFDVNANETNKNHMNVSFPQGKNGALIVGKGKYDPRRHKNLVYLYDDSTESIKLVGTLKEFHFYSIVSRANADEIIWIDSNNFIYSTEIFNINTNSSRLLKIGEHRARFATARINDRYHMIAGGVFVFTKKSTKVLDVKKLKIVKGPDMKRGRYDHRMVKLSNGNILVIGSYYKPDARSTELFKIWRWVK